MAELYPYQKRAVDFILEKKTAAIFLDPSMGKTLISLDFVSRTRKKTLVICPANPLYLTWLEEVVKWKYLDVSINNMHKTKKWDKTKDIQITTPDTLPILNSYMGGIEVLIVDESTRFKSTTTQRWEKMKLLLLGFNPKYRVLLTGTPSPQGVKDLWAQYFMLDGGERLGGSYSSFFWRYHIKVPRKFAPVQRKGAMEKVVSLVKDITFRLSAEDYLTMPEKLENIVQIRSTPKFKNMYNTVTSEKKAELLKKITPKLKNDAPSPIGGVMYGFKRQLCGGAYYTYEDEVRKVINHNNLKIDALKELILELNRPLIIVYAFIHEIDRILSICPPETVVYQRLTMDLKQKVIKHWNSGDIKVLLLHPKSTAHGINLQYGGRDLIWYTLTDNLEEYIQMNDRIYRSGQKGKVIIHHLAIDKTHDQKAIELIKDKNYSQETLLQAMKGDIK